MQLRPLADLNIYRLICRALSGVRISPKAQEWQRYSLLPEPEWLGAWFPDVNFASGMPCWWQSVHFTQ
jgi:hypothetical protein